MQTNASSKPQKKLVDRFVERFGDADVNFLFEKGNVEVITDDARVEMKTSELREQLELIENPSQLFPVA